MWGVNIRCEYLKFTSVEYEDATHAQIPHYQCLSNIWYHSTTEEERQKYCDGGVTAVNNGKSLEIIEDFENCPRYKIAKSDLK